MNFETAKVLSEIIHYVFTIGLTLLFVFKTYKNFINLVIKFYLIFFGWGLLCFLIQGCPITLFENWLSLCIYGKEFYPNYTYTDTDFHYLITNSDFYIPGILCLIMIIISKFNTNGNSTSNSNLSDAVGTTKTTSYSS